MDKPMTSPDCQAVRVDLGAYLLGALDPGERVRVASHLERCATCRDELAGLAVLPGLLGRISPDDLATDHAPRAGGAERLLAELHGRRRGRRRRQSIAIVGAFAVLVVGLLGVRELTSPPRGPVPLTVAATSPTTHVSGHAALTSVPAGTTVGLRIIGVRPGTRCQLIVLGIGGRHEVAGTWLADYEGGASIVGVTAIPENQIRGLVIARDSGQALLVLRLEPSAAKPAHTL